MLNGEKVEKTCHLNCLQSFKNVFIDIMSFSWELSLFVSMATFLL